MRNENFVGLNYFLSKNFINLLDNPIIYGDVNKKFENIFNNVHNYVCIPRYFNMLKEKRYFQPTVEILKSQIFELFNLSNLIEADLVLHYFRCLSNKERSNQYIPRFSIYIDKCQFNFLTKLFFNDQINDVLIVFGIDSKEKLLAAIKESKFPYDEYQLSDYGRVPRLENLINSDFWGTK